MAYFKKNPLSKEYSSDAIFEFFKEFEVVKAENKYINITLRTDYINILKEKIDLPITNYSLTEIEIKKVLSHKF